MHTGNRHAYHHSYERRLTHIHTGNRPADEDVYVSDDVRNVDLTRGIFISTASHVNRRCHAIVKPGFHYPS